MRKIYLAIALFFFSHLVQPNQDMALSDPVPSDSARLEPVFDLLEKAVRDGVAPGGVLAVGHKGRLLALHPFGHLTYDTDSPKVTPETVYDLASLTKVVATTTAAMRLNERKLLDLELPIGQYLPEFLKGPDPEARHLITPWHLLTHSSGLPAYVQFFLDNTIKNRAQVLDKIYAQPLTYEPGTAAVYSDLGIILMSEILARISDQPFETVIHNELILPLDLKNTRYNPPESWHERIAPTENGAGPRDYLIWGEVHDENTFLMGGVSGHAGLFSTAKDLSHFAQMLLNGGIYRQKQLLSPDTINHFTRRQDIPHSTRAIGWDTASRPPDRSSGGSYVSDNAFGHTGFTGTSIWIDPDKNLFIILLTNRVHPTRDNNEIRALRPVVANTVFEALGL